MMNEKHLVIHQTPVPQPRPRVTRFGTYDPAKDKKTFIRVQLQEQITEKLDCPIEIETLFYMPIPKSTSKKKALLMKENVIKHVKRPDCDNCFKLITDCLNDLVIKDDSQIYKIYIEKRYSDDPRTEIIIRW